MTIYTIKYRIPQHKSELFFSRRTLKFFGQTLRDFSVTQAIPHKKRFFIVCAPAKHRTTTCRLYDDHRRDFISGVTDLKEVEKYLQENKEKP